MKRLALHAIVLCGALLAAAAPLAQQASQRTQAPSTDGKLNIIAFGAHPDDCDQRAAGIAAKYAALDSRIPYAAARDGYFVSMFGRLHRTARFPHVSLVVLGVISIVCSLLPLADAPSSVPAQLVVVPSHSGQQPVGGSRPHVLNLDGVGLCRGAGAGGAPNRNRQSERLSQPECGGSLHRYSSRAVPEAGGLESRQFYCCAVMSVANWARRGNGW
jgi:hypothetical protein